MTTPTCPLGGLIAENARAAVESAVGKDWTVKVAIDKAAVWSPELADPAVRSRFEIQLTHVDLLEATILAEVDVLAVTGRIEDINPR